MQFPTIYPVACHTDNVGPGTIFVAINGTKHNGIDYIKNALIRGASTIVIASEAVLPEEIVLAITNAQAKLVRVDNTRKALAELSAEKLDHPAKKLKIIGITGTKGKSTSTFLLAHTLKKMGYKTAMLSTVKNCIGEIDLPTQLTTQLPDYLQIFFNECVMQEVEYVVMEVAAQAFSLYRVWDIEFSAGLFTNFSQEHFEFYASMEEYFAAKAQIMQQLKPGAVISINSDDIWLNRLMNPSAQTFGLKTGNLVAADIITNLDGITCNLIVDAKTYPMRVPALVGEFNVYNCLGVLSVCHSLGLSMAGAIKALETFTSVPGRLQRFILPNGALGLIDYAHNPSSYEAVLTTLKQLTNDLIVVFGAGGDRDGTKRPLMGKVASEIADKIILTTDNPRSEDPAAIIAAIKSGIHDSHMHKVHSELDREQAIKKAYALSSSSSVIVLLGKGPDEYQIIKDKKLHFSEAAILKAL